MATVLQWFLFGMFVWACCLLMSALEARVSASGEDRKQRQPKARRGAWWQQLMGDGSENIATEAPTEREQAMAAEIVELKDRIATLEAIVTDRKYQWEDELGK